MHTLDAGYSITEPVFEPDAMERIGRALAASDLPRT